MAGNLKIYSLQKSKSIISLFFTTILVTGLIASVIHAYQGDGTRVIPFSEEESTWVENHEYCPICAITIRGDEPVAECEHSVDLSVDQFSDFVDDIIVNKDYAVYHGRAPPCFG